MKKTVALRPQAKRIIFRPAHYSLLRVGRSGRGNSYAVPPITGKVIITSSVEDIIASPIGIALIANSTTRIVLGEKAVGAGKPRKQGKI